MKIFFKRTIVFVLTIVTMLTIYFGPKTLLTALRLDNISSEISLINQEATATGWTEAKTERFNSLSEARKEIYSAGGYTSWFCKQHALVQLLLCLIFTIMLIGVILAPAYSFKLLLKQDLLERKIERLKSSQK